MLRRLSLPRNVVPLTAAVLVCYLGVWLSFDHLHRIDNDFIGTYLASWLLAGGHRTGLYDPAVQNWARDLLVGPVPGGLFMPFVNVPLAAVIAAPLTLFAPADAYTAWSSLQLVLLFVAVGVAYRSAPRPTGHRAIEGLAIVLLVLSSYATLDLIRAGQWDGLNALGVAMAYRSWRQDRHAAGSFWLVATAALAKPHLALGLVAFILGWRNRRALAGAVAAAISVAVASIALVGVSGASAWLHLLNADAHAASVRGQSSFVALAGNWAGDGPWTFPIADAGIVVILGLCLLLGHRFRQGRLQLGPALAAATCLSLLAAPHSFIYDTVMVAPAVTWLLAERSPFSLTPRVHRRAWATAMLWHGTTTLYFLNQMISPTILRVGTPSIWIEVGLAALLWWVAHSVEEPGAATSVRRRRAAKRPLPALEPVATAP
jgi:hypothetical protein